MTALRRVLLIAMLAASVAGCEETPDPGPSNPNPTSVRDLFASTLSPGGFRFYSFPVFEDGAIWLTLASVTDGLTGPSLSPTLFLGLGIPSGTDCATFLEVQATPSLFPQVDGHGLRPGTYCVRVADRGSLSGTVNFAVRMVYPNLPTIAALDPRTETFASTLPTMGFASRTITATQTGTVTVTLESLGGGIDAVGLGIGVRRFDGSCAFTRSQVASPASSPQISMVVPAGVDYCVQIYDLGTLTAPISFAIALAIP
jgi:hypothetical protein